MGLWEKIDSPESRKYVAQKEALFKMKQEAARKMQKQGYGENGQKHDFDKHYRDTGGPWQFKKKS